MKPVSWFNFVKSLGLYCHMSCFVFIQYCLFCRAFNAALLRRDSEGRDVWHKLIERLITVCESLSLYHNWTCVSNLLKGAGMIQMGISKRCANADAQPLYRFYMLLRWQESKQMLWQLPPNDLHFLLLLLEEEFSHLHPVLYIRIYHYHYRLA